MLDLGDVSLLRHHAPKSSTLYFSLGDMLAIRLGLSSSCIFNSRKRYGRPPPSMLQCRIHRLFNWHRRMHTGANNVLLDGDGLPHSSSSRPVQLLGDHQRMFCPGFPKFRSGAF
ncbi:hypothetical protein M0R45_017837 [Rubus argutus]|uniref:Uncharacterized protein n=1 Tax=Rubus argutus TaxID=59490 RepID=A0AAW1XZ91_RUBAR